MHEHMHAISTEETATVEIWTGPDKTGSQLGSTSSGVTLPAGSATTSDLNFRLKKLQ
jgi:hypothetical protein